MAILKAGASGSTFNLDGNEYTKGLYEAIYSNVSILPDGESDEKVLQVGLRNINTGETIQEPIMIRAWKNGSNVAYTTLDSLVADLTSVAGLGSSGDSGLEVLTTYPTVDASKAGQQFLYQGQLWHYITADESSSVAEGTPWPSKGYKQITISLTVNVGDPTVITTNVFQDDFNIASLVPNFTRSQAGRYISGIFSVGSAAPQFQAPFSDREVVTSQSSNSYCSSSGLSIAFNDNLTMTIDAFQNGALADGTGSSVCLYAVTTKVYLPQ